jgi:hypothetical protein
VERILGTFRPWFLRCGSKENSRNRLRIGVLLSHSLGTRTFHDPGYESHSGIRCSGTVPHRSVVCPSARGEQKFLYYGIERLAVLQVKAARARKAQDASCARGGRRLTGRVPESLASK